MHTTWMSALMLVLAGTAHGQVLVVDDFETGAFTADPGESFTQTLPDANVLGGKRTVRVFGGSVGEASVADGQLTLTREDNTSVTLSYGGFGDPNQTEHLHFDAGPLGETALNIAVPQVRREPLTVIARIYSFTIENGTPAEGFSSASFTFRSGEPLTKSVALGDFAGDANLRDIAGFQLQLGDVDFLRGTFEVSGATLTPVPEPAEAALATAAGLCGAAILRSLRRSKAAKTRTKTETAGPNTGACQRLRISAITHRCFTGE